MSTRDCAGSGATSAELEAARLLLWSVSDRARLRELERENRELCMKAEFLGKAAAFFAQDYR